MSLRIYPSLLLLLLTLQVKVCLEDDGAENPGDPNQVFYPGYPGVPLPQPGQPTIEQVPGYAHPYLPGLDTHIQIKDFLWTGSGDGETDFVTIDSSRPTVAASKSSTVNFLFNATVKGQGQDTWSVPDRHTQALDPPEKPRTFHEYGDNGVDLYSSTAVAGVTPNGLYEMPLPKYLIRTVIKNGTDLIKGSVDIYSFKQEMEDRLTRTYRRAFSRQHRAKRAAPRRWKRSETDNLKVRIHNIRSALPEPEIEILYTVYEEDKEPVLAEEAVKLVDENVGNDDAVLLLGHPLKIKAEPYLKQDKLRTRGSSSDWLIASVILAIFLALLLVWILFLVYKQYWRQNGKKHNILISSNSASKHGSPSAPRKETPSPTKFDNASYTLERPRPQTNYITEDGDLEPGETGEAGRGSGGRGREAGRGSGGRRTTGSQERVRSKENLQRNGREAVEGRGRLTSEESLREIQSEGDGMADHSSNNTPEIGKKSKKGGGKRREKRRRRKAGGLSTSDEDMSDSAFPAKTPENLKILDDLMEEDIPLPGDSGRGSVHPGQPDWAFLPDTPEHDWEESAKSVQETARVFQDTLDSVLTSRDSRSAKSHLIRKGTVEQRVEEGLSARPWSAAEPRWNADRMFHSKQRGWEHLARGRKHLHHGQLLPGSTESEEDAPPRGVTCWSEGDSPRRPDSTATEHASPLIKAIRNELQRFQRRPNSGVVIINDPETIKEAE